MTTTKNEIRTIQEQQIQEVEAKLRFIADNFEEMITQIRIKQGEELSKYATSKDYYSLWRGASIDNYVFSNLLNNTYSDIRKDMNSRLNPPAQENELVGVSDQITNEIIEELNEELPICEHCGSICAHECDCQLYEEDEEIEKPQFKHSGTIHADQLTTDMITIVDLTDLEKQVMKALVDDGLWYNWGSEPLFSDVTPQELSDVSGIEGRRLRGVLSSLTKKNMLYVEDMSDWGRKDIKIVYPLYNTYKAYEADNQHIKIEFGIDDEE